MPEAPLSSPHDAAPRLGRGHKGWAPLLVKVAVSIGLLVFLGRQVSWDRVALRLNDVAFVHVLLALSPLVAITFLVGVRWRFIASAVARPIGLLEAWIVCTIGTAFDQAFVMLSGDAYRIWWLRKGVPSLARAVAGVILDRAAGVLGIAVLVIAFLPQFMSIDSTKHLSWIPTTLAGAIVVAFAGLMTLDLLPVPRSANRLLASVRVLSASARTVFLSPLSAIPALGAAVLVHIGIASCVASLAWALHIELTFPAALTVVPTVMLIALLPISIGGWGVREGAMVVGLGMVGVDGSDALLISLMYGLGAAAVGVSGAILWLVGLPGQRAETGGA